MSRRNNNQLPDNLPQLQNLIKRDPVSYKDEFSVQYEYMKNQLSNVLLTPSFYDEEFAKVVMFTAQVADLYPEMTKDFPETLRNLVQTQATMLDRHMRETLCRALILLRNKGLIAATALLELFFELFRCHDKMLRKMLYTFIIEDIKNVNSKRKNTQLNSTLQTFMRKMLVDENETAAKMSLDVMIEMYRKQIWNDARCVNIVATALTSKVIKLQVAALQFFLGNEGSEIADSDEEDEEEKKKSKKDLLMANRVAKKTKKRERKLKKALKDMKNNKKKTKVTALNFPAIHLIHDPQSMAETLYNQLAKSNERAEVKQMHTNFLSRLIGVHELFVFNFYPFLQKYLQPHTTDVTKLLLFVAQASHSKVPPEVLEGVIKGIADKFITERNSAEAMAVGLNAVREICARCPLAINEELLQDLVQYKSYRNKSVAMSARSLMMLYRDKRPELLVRKDRGKPTECQKEADTLQYGSSNPKDYIPGAEALNEDESAEEDGLEECSDDEDSDGSWIDVHHSDDEGDADAEDGQIPLDPAEKVAKAQNITQSRFISQEEFKKIRLREAQKMIQADPSNRIKGLKRKVGDEEKERGEILDLAHIERLRKRPRHDKESRLATVIAGQKDRGEYGGKKEFRHDPHASTTNKEKRKGKNFMMVKHKINRKQNSTSFRDKQIRLKTALLKKLKSK